MVPARAVRHDRLHGHTIAIRHLGPADPTGSHRTHRRSTDASPAPPLPRRLPQLSAARWLAGAGASLLLVASIVVVAGNWESIDESVRFSGLVAALVAVYFVAEAARRRSPQTASALAALAAMLTAPVGIAAAATLSQPWPVCILVGGLASLIATEVQSRRWDIPLLRAVAVVSFGLAATGLAALMSVPVALIGACGAVAALGLGAPRRAVALGLAVGASPVLVALVRSRRRPRHAGSDRDQRAGTVGRTGVVFHRRRGDRCRRPPATERTARRCRTGDVRRRRGQRNPPRRCGAGGALVDSRNGAPVRRAGRVVDGRSPCWSTSPDGCRRP